MGGLSSPRPGTFSRRIPGGRVGCGHLPSMYTRVLMHVLACTAHVSHPIAMAWKMSLLSSVLTLKMQPASSQCLHPHPLGDLGRQEDGCRTVAPSHALAILKAACLPGCPRTRVPVEGHAGGLGC